MMHDYTTLNGQPIDLRALPKADLLYLVGLLGRALSDKDYFGVELEVCGRFAYPLKGSERVTREVQATPLFRVARDIAYRLGIRQGFLADEPDAPSPTEALVDVAQAARRLGISRAAVVKAAQAGRLKGKKIGRSWALLQTSVEAYEVAAYRVKAGKARWIPARSPSTAPRPRARAGRS